MALARALTQEVSVHHRTQRRGVASVNTDWEKTLGQRKLSWQGQLQAAEMGRE